VNPLTITLIVAVLSLAAAAIISSRADKLRASNNCKRSALAQKIEDAKRDSLWGCYTADELAERSHAAGGGR
jgi:hypothetical protein